MKNFLRFFAIFVLSAFFAEIATAQSSALIFEKSTIDFGIIAEEGGTQTKFVSATNSGETPIYIKDVTTSCGCTVASYSRDAIFPGESTTIGVTFDPRDRPGRFERHMLISTSDSSQGVRIEVIGRVTPRERTIYELYPFDMGGGLRMESNFHAFAYIEHGAQVEERIAYVNNSEREISLSIEEVESSGALSLSYPHHIAPHASGDIVLSYALDENSERYGTLSDIIRFVIDGQPSKTLFSTYAIAVDNFTLVEDILAPTAVISKKIVKFGDTKRGKTMTDATVYITNDGERDLIIRAVEWQSEAMKCSLKAGDVIPAGERRELHFTFDSGVCNYGVWVDRVKIITNDPVRPMDSIRLTAIVVE